LRSSEDTNEQCYVLFFVLNGSMYLSMVVTKNKIDDNKKCRQRIASDLGCHADQAVHIA